VTWPQFFLLFFVGLPGALFFAYAIGIQYQRESLPRWLRNVCEVIAGFALLIDVAAEWTVLSLYLWERPRQHEYTFSDRLERLVTENGWRSRIAWPIALLLNWIAPPGHPHILNAARGRTMETTTNA
jgi:hypothetical protein